jgi:hypothetical protein
MLDLLLSFSLLALYPAFMFIVKKPIGLIRNIFGVLLGFKSWVGYSSHGLSDIHLPEIRKGVLNPEDAFNGKEIPEDVNTRLNLLYARDYKLANDANIIVKGFREMGRR